MVGNSLLQPTRVLLLPTAAAKLAMNWWAFSVRIARAAWKYTCSQCIRPIWFYTCLFVFVLHQIQCVACVACKRLKVYLNVSITSTSSFICIQRRPVTGRLYDLKRT